MSDVPIIGGGKRKPSGPPIPPMPNAARLTATPCDEWIIQLVGHLAAQTTALGTHVNGHVQRIDRNMEQIATGLNDIIERLNNLEAKVADIERAIDEADDE